jgi:hypothetical protein
MSNDFTSTDYIRFCKRNTNYSFEMFNEGLTFTFQDFLKLFPCFNYEPYHAKLTFISFRFDISGITLSLTLVILWHELCCHRWVYMSLSLSLSLTSVATSLRLQNPFVQALKLFYRHNPLEILNLLKLSSPLLKHVLINVKSESYTFMIIPFESRNIPAYLSVNSL